MIALFCDTITEVSTREKTKRWELNFANTGGMCFQLSSYFTSRDIDV